MGLSKKDVELVVKKMDISNEDVMATYKNWMEVNPSGKITRKDFSEMFVELVGVDHDSSDSDDDDDQNYKDGWAKIKDCAEKIVENVFRVFDANNDGHIDFVEFMVYLAIINDNDDEKITIREKMEKIFRFFDMNSDGTISRNEMKRVVKAFIVLIKLLQDGEAKSAAVIAKTVFTEMDEDGDGRITKDEFISAIMADKDEQTMSQMLVECTWNLLSEDGLVMKMVVPGLE